MCLAFGSLGVSQSQDPSALPAPAKVREHGDSWYSLGGQGSQIIGGYEIPRDVPVRGTSGTNPQTGGDPSLAYCPGGYHVELTKCLPHLVPGTPALLPGSEAHLIIASQGGFADLRPFLGRLVC